MIKNIDKFNKIYNSTYNNTLKYIIIKCNNINDTNDILQETYLELWKILNKKEILETNINSYILSIANNKIKKHYTLLKRLNLDKNINDELIETIKSNINIEDLIIKENEWNTVWNYIKKKKNQNIPKVFYLYYKLELPIKKIALELNISESNVKNIIYRTLKELESINL